MDIRLLDLRKLKPCVNALETALFDYGAMKQGEASMNQDLTMIMDQVTLLGEMSEDDARKIMAIVYSDGIVSRSEAETLFRIRKQLSETDPLWGPRFSEGVKDYLLGREMPEGWVTQEEAEWLKGEIHRSGDVPCLDDIDLLISLLREAEGVPQELALFTLEAICQQIQSAGRASSNLVDRAKATVFAMSSDGGSWVSRNEAMLLFETNDTIASADNEPEWNEFFARAIANHLLARAHPNPQSEAEALSRQKWLSDTSVSVGRLFAAMPASFAKGSWFENVFYSPEKARKARYAADAAADQSAAMLTDDEEAWVVKKMFADKTTSPAEQALIDFLNKEFPGFAAGLAAAA